MWSAPYPTVLGTYAPLITPSLTRAHLRGLAETDVDHGFPKSRRCSSGMSKMHRDESSTATRTKPAGKQKGTARDETLW